MDSRIWASHTHILFRLLKRQKSTRAMKLVRNTVEQMNLGKRQKYKNKRIAWRKGRETPSSSWTSSTQRAQENKTGPLCPRGHSTDRIYLVFTQVGFYSAIWLAERRRGVWDGKEQVFRVRKRWERKRQSQTAMEQKRNVTGNRIQARLGGWVEVIDSLTHSPCREDLLVLQLNPLKRLYRSAQSQNACGIIFFPSSLTMIPPKALETSFWQENVLVFEALTSLHSTTVPTMTTLPRQAFESGRVCVCACVRESSEVIGQRHVSPRS